MPGDTFEPRQPVQAGKLTRRFLMSMPDGQYPVSNCYNHVGPGQFEPCFAERVAPLAEREPKWQRIKDSHANGRDCDLCVDEAHFAAWRKTVKGAPWNQG